MSNPELISQQDVPAYIQTMLGKAAYLIISELHVQPPVFTQLEAHGLTDAIDGVLHESETTQAAMTTVAPRGDGTVSIHVDNMEILDR